MTVIVSVSIRPRLARTSSAGRRRHPPPRRDRHGLWRAWLENGLRKVTVAILWPSCMSSERSTSFSDTVCLQSERNNRGIQGAACGEGLQDLLPAEAEFAFRDRHEFIQHLHSGHAALVQELPRCPVARIFLAKGLVMLCFSELLKITKGRAG